MVPRTLAVTAIITAEMSLQRMWLVPGTADNVSGRKEAMTSDLPDFHVHRTVNGWDGMESK